MRVLRAIRAEWKYRVELFWAAVDIIVEQFAMAGARWYA